MPRFQFWPFIHAGCAMYHITSQRMPRRKHTAMAGATQARRFRTFTAAGGGVYAGFLRPLDSGTVRDPFVGPGRTLRV
ncbi:MAG: hypothetical protein JWM93_2421 [Frankiales bacterium]|nr:hypothetical protein [Frankiales bacterium]